MPFLYSSLNEDILVTCDEGFTAFTHESLLLQLSDGISRMSFFAVGKRVNICTRYTFKRYSNLQSHTLRKLVPHLIHREPVMTVRNHLLNTTVKRISNNCKKASFSNTLIYNTRCMLHNHWPVQMWYYGTIIIFSWFLDLGGVFWRRLWFCFSGFENFRAN